MNFVFLTWIALSVASVNSLTSVKNTRNLIGVFNGQTRATASCTNFYGPICGDCSTLWTCVGRDPPILKQTCALAYPGQPYCVDGTCTSVIDPNDATCSTGFECTAAGYFPNPSNCSQYYLCSKPLGQSFVYECLNGYVYNPVDNGCKRRNSAADCYTINCAANLNRYIVYPGDRAYYAFCYNDGGVINPIMFRCDDPDNFQYNPTQRQCVFQCKSEGRVADRQNCQRYYECYRTGSTYMSQRQTCITGFIFDDTVKRCVVGTCPSSGDAGNDTGGSTNGGDTSNGSSG